MTDQPAPDFEEARRMVAELRDIGRVVDNADIAVGVGRLDDIADEFDALFSEREAREERAFDLARGYELLSTYADFSPGDDHERRILKDADAALPATESAQAEQAHTKECEERRYLHHVATGGDLEDCFCPLLTEESPQAEQPTSEAGS